MNRRAIAGTIAGILCAVITQTASSALINGTVYLDDPTSTDASIIPASTLPHANFTTSDINFNTLAGPTSIATFLNNPPFTNLANGFDPNHLTDNTFLILTGQTFLNAGANSFVVGHDDGVVLTMGGGLGTVVNAPGPSAFTTTPFEVNAPTAGYYSFTLQYAECCGSPADLIFQVNGAPVTNVPEPVTVAMLAAGLAGLALFGRRRRSTLDPR
ncbi:MAG: PEP-CTERM sorting domain-containing protein, partial [Betaproteobacteria bacterium]